MNEQVILLKLAKTRIKTRQNTYVCDAVGMAADSARIDQVATRPITRYISTLLAPYGTLDGWMHVNGYSKGCDLRQDDYNQKMRETRLAWIDDLIKHFEGLQK